MVAANWRLSRPCARWPRSVGCHWSSCGHLWFTGLAAQEISKGEKEQAKAGQIDRLAAQEIAKAEKEQAKADKEADKEAKESDKIVRLAAKEIAKAEKELKQNLAVRKAWEKMTQRLAIDAPGAVFSQRIIVVE